MAAVLEKLAPRKGGETITLQQAFTLFESSLLQRPVSAEAQGMYLRLLYHANLGRYRTMAGVWVFPKWVSVSTADLMDVLGIRQRKTLYKIRDELIQAGYIRTKAEPGAATTSYLLTQILSVEDRREAEAELGAPLPVPVAERQGSFDLNEFFVAAVRHSMGDEIADDYARRGK